MSWRNCSRGSLEPWMASFDVLRLRFATLQDERCRSARGQAPTAADTPVSRFRTNGVVAPEAGSYGSGHSGVSRSGRTVVSGRSYGSGHSGVSRFRTNGVVALEARSYGSGHSGVSRFRTNGVVAPEDTPGFLRQRTLRCQPLQDERCRSARGQAPTAADTRASAASTRGSPPRRSAGRFRG